MTQYGDSAAGYREAVGGVANRALGDREETGRGRLRRRLPVSDETGKYALEIESATESVQVLKMEVLVLCRAQQARRTTLLQDRGPRPGSATITA